MDPLAAAIIEQRRDLLWTRDNAPRVAQILRALTHRPEDLFRDTSNYLRLRAILRRMETYMVTGLSEAERDETAQALWDLAIQLEEGDIGDALERMRRAQDRLSQAMRDGANDQEIARLMQELREATQDYLRQLQRQAQEQDDDDERNQAGQPGLELSQQDLQALMDRIQELMEQGRMAEAEQALREFQELMENMQVTEGQQGQGQSAGEQAMEGLAETLRNQQGLSDQAFRDLQEQFNPNAQAGESQGNEGRDGGQGRGQSHQPGDGTGEGGEGSEGQQASPNGQDQQQGGEGSLAEQQRTLRQELERQQQNLPFGSSPEGEETRDALDRAGRAMDDAEQALRQGDLAEAIDRQSDAMESLREGMRSLGEAMAEQQGNQNGQQPANQTAQGDNRDPLGRGLNDGGDKIGDGQAYRRAWDLFEDIRRRAGEQERSQTERNYLQRLLDRF